MTRTWTSLRVGAIVLALTAGLGLPAMMGRDPAAASGIRGINESRDGAARTSVTLITGDRVVVDGRDDHVRVEPAAGRERMQFSRESYHGDLLVVPADAAPMVAAGVLDRRLFNVTQLLANGHSDAERHDVPLIVRYDAGKARAATAILRAGDARTERALPSIGGAAVTTSKRSVARFWTGIREGKRSAASTARHPFADGIAQVWLDGPVKVSLDESVPQVGAPQAWQAGYTGKGVTVAVLDTGIDATHPDLADAVVKAQDFTGNPNGADDGNGHGTHVASIITGNGTASNGTYRGVAPDAVLMNGKVLDDNGFGTESAIIAGMQWAATQGADVVNVSFGGAASDGTDPMSEAVNELTRTTGTLFVVAAGNSGPDEQTIRAPGAADAALTVGAVDKADGLAEFSSRGPRIGDLAIKPELTAPGVGIVAARATHGSAGTPGESYVTMSGTSMATPHVAGAAAIVASQHPEWTAEQLKSALIGSAVANPELSVDQQGGGRLDVGRAVTAHLSTAPASVSLGLARWPHHDDTARTTKLTYSNSGSTAVTVSIAVEVRDPSGQPAPDGMFTIVPDRVTVPAGGTATVALTSDTSVPGPDGRYGGAIVAKGTDGNAPVRTPIAVTREVESYDVTVDYAGRDGQSTAWFLSKFINIDTNEWYFPWDPSGTVTLRLPKGRYFFDAWIFDPFDFLKSTTVAEPTLDVTRDIHIAADARDGKPIDVRLDRPEAEAGLAVLRFIRETPWGQPFREVISFSLDGVYAVPSRTSAPGKEFIVLLDADLARPDGQGGFMGSPYFYRIRSLTYGNVPDRLEPRFRDRDLVRVDSTHAASTEGKVGEREHMVVNTLPFTLTEYYSPGAPFVGAFYEPTEGLPFGYGENRPVKMYDGDRPLTERWNYAVFGPAFPYEHIPGDMAGRTGDIIEVDMPMFTDQGRDHVGFSAVDTTRTALFRDGILVGDSPYPWHGYGSFAVPGGEATYRLETDATRSNSALSTRVTATWTFRSGTTAGDKTQPLPLLAVRFAPELDERNRAPKGRTYSVPVYVQRNGDSAAPQLTDIALEASYDDGATWQPVRVERTGEDWLALMPHPADAQFVSIRASATDTAGNSVDETIIRAYGLR